MCYGWRNNNRNGDDSETMDPSGISLTIKDQVDANTVTLF